MKSKWLLGLFVFVIVFTNFSGYTYASSDEQDRLDVLKNNISITTHDGFFDKDYGLELDEGAVIINLMSQSDLELFKLLSNEGKKKLLVDVAQSNWGDYLGVEVCYAVVTYNSKLYAIANVNYESTYLTVALDYSEQGKNDLQPWRNNAALTFSQDEKDRVNATTKPAVIQKVTLKEKGVILKSNSMIPAAAVFKNLGGTLQYDSRTKSINMYYKDVSMSAKLDSKYVKINGATRAYAIAPQLIEGKLMVPVQLLKDLFDAKISVESDTYNYNDTYIKSVTLTTSKAQVTIPINDLYETYQEYFGKTMWVHTPQLLIKDLYGNYGEGMKNLSAVKIANVTRNGSIGSWINVYFIYNGKTYVAELEDYEFKFGFYSINPRKQYNFSSKYWSQIENHQISTGMNSDMVYLSWGLYDRHLKDAYSWGTTDLWVYERSIGGDKYLYFINDVLQSISTY